MIGVPFLMGIPVPGDDNRQRGRLDPVQSEGGASYYAVLGLPLRISSKRGVECCSTQAAA